MTTNSSQQSRLQGRHLVVQKHTISATDQDDMYSKIHDGRFNGNSSVKATSKKSFKCGVCHMPFLTVQTLTRHIEYYGNPNHPCKECSKEFSDTRQLDLHMESSHPGLKRSSEYEFQCPVCKQMVATKRCLQSHLYHYHSPWMAENTNYFVYKLRGKDDEDETSSNTVVRYSESESVVMDPTSTLQGLKDVTIFRKSTGPLPPANPRKARDAPTLSSSSVEDTIGVRPTVEIHQSPIELTSTNSQKTLDNSLSSLTSIEDVIGVRPYVEMPENPTAYPSTSTPRTFDASLPSLSSIENIIGVRPFVKIHGNPMEFEALLTDVKVEKCGDVEDSWHDDSSRDLLGFKVVSRDVQVKTCEDKDDILRALHSCRECFVPLSRIEIPEKIIAKATVLTGTRIGSPKKNMKAIAQPADVGASLKIEAVSTGQLLLNETIKIEPELTAEAATESPKKANECSLLEGTAVESEPIEKKPDDESTNIMIASKICDKYFKTKRAMQRHFRQRHIITAGDTVYCVCGKTMQGRRDKELHFYKNCGENVAMDAAKSQSDGFASCQPLEKKFECPKCGDKFWMETCLKDHQRRCTPGRVGTLELRTLTTEVQSRYRQMPRNPSEYVCRVCNSGFKSSKALAQHVQKYSNTERHPCPICKTLFTGRRLLKNHVLATHEQGRKHFYSVFCEICDQGFTKTLYKRIHIMHCHPVEGLDDSDVNMAVRSRCAPRKGKTFSKNFAMPDNTCKVCNLEFVSRKRFIDHTVYYKRDEIIYCGICGKDFDGQYMAHSHNKKFHYAQDMQRAYTHRCTICQDGFMYRTHLRAHIAHVHENPTKGNERADANPNIGKLTMGCSKVYSKLTCKVCEVNFPNAAVLSKHEMNYSNDGEFVCNQCPRKCRSAAILVEHISLNHSGAALPPGGIKCSRCDETLMTRMAWVCHVKHFHNSDGDEPSEFFFENNVPTSTEFGNFEVELIPTNESISSGMAYVNIGNSADTTESAPLRVKHSEMSGVRVRQYGKSLSRTADNTGGPVNVVEKIRANCNTCGLVCSRTAELAEHIAVYSNTGHYNCTICGRKFTWQRFYESHKLKHFRHEPENTHFCPTCDEGFRSITDMKIHQAHLHQVCSDIDEENGSPAAMTIKKNTAVESSLILECRRCKEKFLTAEGLEAHSKDVHECINDTRDSSNSVDGSAKCNTCEAVFVNKASLMIHRSNFHLSESASAESAMNNKCRDTGNRFYILAGIDILPEALDVLEKNFDSCNKRLGLADCIYRYGPSFKCEICGIIFASKDLLSNHQTKMHTVSSIVELENDGFDKSSSVEPEVAVVRKVIPYRPTSKGVIVRKVVRRQFFLDVPHAQNKAVQRLSSTSDFSPAQDEAIQSSSSSIDSLPAENRKKPQPPAEQPKKIALPEFTKSILKPMNAKPASQVVHYRCKVCDVIFPTNHLLRIHEGTSECLKGSIDRSDDVWQGKEKDTVAEELQALMKNLPVELGNSKEVTIHRVYKQNQVSCNGDETEPAKISAPTKEVDSPIAKSTGNVELEKPIGRLIVPIPSSSSTERFIKLPTGVYRIVKLKGQQSATAIRNRVVKLPADTTTQNKFVNLSAVSATRNRIVKLQTVTATQNRIVKLPAAVVTPKKIVKVPADIATRNKIVELPAEIATPNKIVKLPADSTTQNAIFKLPAAIATQNKIVKVLAANRKDEVVEATTTAVKRAKTEFNTAVYEELCRQHNLVPASDERKRKTPTKTVNVTS